ncbi:hypothetical protein V6Z11_D10G290300 [Gossypium hirsutum]
MFFKASHSARKLLEAPRFRRLSTFTAITAPLASRTPLYTEPKLPEPTKFCVENPSVALTMLWYDNCKRELSTQEVVDCSFFFLNHKMRRQVKTKVTPKVTTIIATFNLRELLDDVFELHLNKCNSGTPPQSLLFPSTNVAVPFLKTPPLGITPSKLLKERFKYLKAPNLTRNSGISPERLLLDTSNASSPLSELNEEGMGPPKKFPSKNSFSRLTQLPRFSGSKPDNLF